MMPFYGKTPDEAARLLSRWLSIAHGQAHQSYSGRCAATLDSPLFVLTLGLLPQSVSCPSRHR